MSDRTQDRSGSKAARNQRLGAALRDNLRRRKAQAKVRAARAGDGTGGAQDPNMGHETGTEAGTETGRKTGSETGRDDS